MRWVETVRFPFLLGEAGDSLGFKHSLCVKEMEMPTGHFAPLWAGGAGKQHRAAHSLAPWRNVPALGTLYPFACHLGGICVQGWCWQEALSECNPLPATGEKERFGVVSSQCRDLSRSLLQGHVCTAMAMWQFSVVLWKKRKKGGNTVGTPGLRVPCLSWVMRASATQMRESILCQTVKGNVKYYNGLSISLCLICFLYPFFQVPFCSPPRQTNVIMVFIALSVG